MFWYSVYNLFLMLLLATGFYMKVKMGWTDMAMAALANLSHYGIHWLAVGAGLALLARVFRPWPRVFRAAAGTLCTLLLFVLFVDFGIFRLYHYHINGLVLHVVFDGGLGEAVHLGPMTWLFIGIGVMILVSTQALYFLFLEPKLAGLAALSSMRLKAWLVSLLLVAVLADKLLYGTDKLFNNTGYVRFTKAIPLYHQFSMKRFAKRFLGYRPEDGDVYRMPTEGSTLDYPPLPPVKKPLRRPPNILIIIPDAWRHDMLDPEVTPNLARFSRSCWRYNNHWSNGNATEYGVFTMLYGIPGTYWYPFLNERQGPAIVDLMLQLGYQFKIIGSASMTFQGFTKTAFTRVTEAISDRLPGEKPYQRDLHQPAELARFLDSERDKNRPFFAFLYLNASHAPYNYPPEFAKFQPVGGSINFLTIDESRRTVTMNQYKNSLHFLDDLTGRILDGIDRRGLMDNTAIIVAGDHGEEFWESGYYGHTDAFTTQQCQCAFLARWPGRGPRVIRQTTQHFDVAYTLFELLGFPELGRRYTLGSSLLTPRSPESWSANGYHIGGIFTKDRVITFNLDDKKEMELTVRDWNYKPLPPEQQKEELKKNRKYLLKTLDDQKKFYR